MTVNKLCASPIAKMLGEFINQVYRIEFEEKPNYAKLRYTLLELIDKDINSKFVQ